MRKDITEVIPGIRKTRLNWITGADLPDAPSDVDPRAIGVAVDGLFGRDFSDMGNGGEGPGPEPGGVALRYFDWDLIANSPVTQPEIRPVSFDTSTLGVIIEPMALVNPQTVTAKSQDPMSGIVGGNEYGSGVRGNVTFFMDLTDLGGFDTPEMLNVSKVGAMLMHKTNPSRNVMIGYSFELGGFGILDMATGQPVSGSYIVEADLAQQVQIVVAPVNPVGDSTTVLGLILSSTTDPDEERGIVSFVPWTINADDYAIALFSMAFGPSGNDAISGNITVTPTPPPGWVPHDAEILVELDPKPYQDVGEAELPPGAEVGDAYRAITSGIFRGRGIGAGDTLLLWQLDPDLRVVHVANADLTPMSEVTAIVPTDFPTVGAAFEHLKKLPSLIRGTIHVTARTEPYTYEEMKLSLNNDYYPWLYLHVEPGATYNDILDGGNPIPPIRVYGATMGGISGELSCVASAGGPGAAPIDITMGTFTGGLGRSTNITSPLVIKAESDQVTSMGMNIHDASWVGVRIEAPALDRVFLTGPKRGDNPRRVLFWSTDPMVSTNANKVDFEGGSWILVPSFPNTEGPEVPFVHRITIRGDVSLHIDGSSISPAMESQTRVSIEAQGSTGYHTVANVQLGLNAVGFPYGDEPYWDPVLFTASKATLNLSVNRFGASAPVKIDLEKPEGQIDDLTVARAFNDSTVNIIGQLFVGDEAGSTATRFRAAGTGKVTAALASTATGGSSADPFIIPTKRFAVVTQGEYDTPTDDDSWLNFPPFKSGGAEKEVSGVTYRWFPLGGVSLGPILVPEDMLDLPTGG